RTALPPELDPARIVYPIDPRGVAGMLACGALVHGLEPVVAEAEVLAPGIAPWMEQPRTRGVLHGLVAAHGIAIATRIGAVAIGADQVGRAHLGLDVLDRGEPGPLDAARVEVGLVHQA